MNDAAMNVEALNKGVHDSRAIANKLILKGFNDFKLFTQIQIIKMVYFCHAWMLGLYRKPLFWDPVMAWKYGPVIVNVYEGLKHYGKEPVIHPIESDIGNVFRSVCSDLEENVIEQVYAIYGDADGMFLSALTHAKDTPWDQIWSNYQRNAHIPNSMIQKYYEQKFRESNQENS